MCLSLGKPVEERLAFPHRLQDLVYAAIPLKRYKQQLRPIVSYALTVWRAAEKLSKTTCKWHLNSPIFNNHSLLTDNTPFSFPAWSNRGIHVLQDIFDDEGLPAFDNLRRAYNLPGFSFFLYLRFRSLMRVYGIPWITQLSHHALHSILDKGCQTKSMVSALYSLFTQSSYKPLQVQQMWIRDLGLPTDGNTIPWEKVCGTVLETSKNPNHQQFHVNFIHKTCHCMKNQIIDPVNMSSDQDPLL